MKEARVLRERKKIVNYNDDAEQPRGQRKISDLVLAERLASRINRTAGEISKENRKKRERPESRSLREPDADGSGESDGDSDGPSRPSAKRAKSPARNDDDDSDAIEDSDNGANVFVAFARSGKHPAVRQPATKSQSRPSRAAAARASRRISDSAAAKGAEEEEEEDNDFEPAKGGRRGGGQPTRTAAATAKERLRRGAAPTKGGKRSETTEEDDLESEEEEEDGDAAAKGNRGGGRTARRGLDGPDVRTVDGSESESDEDADEDEDMEEAEETVARSKKAPASKAGARGGGGGRPTRKCVERSAANASKRSGRRPDASSESEDTDGSDDSDSDDEEEEEEVVSKKGAAGARGGSRRASARGKAASDEEEEGEEEEDEQEEAAGGTRGSGDSEDSDVQLVRDDGEGDDYGSDVDDDASSSSGNEKDDEEAPAHRGRGRPRKEEAKGRKDAAPQRGRSDKEQGSGKSAAGKAKGKADAKAGKGKGASATKSEKDKGKEKAKGGAKEPPVAATAAGGNGDGKKVKEQVEKILSYDSEKEKYHVKLEGVSYRRTAYVSQSHLEVKKPTLLRNFLNREQNVKVESDWLQVDRVIASRTVSRGRQGPARQLLVRWRGLEYTDSTWEYEEELSSEADKAAIARFERFNAPPAAAARQQSAAAALRQPGFELPTFCSGRSLRDYQQVSVRWMVNNYSQRRNCILGDEMGLGKTAQSISTLETLRVVGGVPGPFLVVAPLSTLGHWQREIETWTDMNVVLLAGSAADRAMIVEHEFYRSSSGSTAGGSRGGGSSRGREVKFNVLLVSYDTLLRERSLLRSVTWSAAVFDEAHRLKGINSSSRATVEDMYIDWLLLLTGTPIQNNMLELYSILALLDPDGYPTPEDFTSRFGGAPGGPPPTVEQIRALQAALAPVLLRRMKEDVEELPQKEEVVVWVELTAAQRAYYRALYEGQIGALLGGASSKNLPSMRNLAMELRKLCCHPVLCDGLEEDLKLKLAAQRSLASAGAPQEFNCPELELLVRGSGKMVLLHKLLHKLRAEGRRVLIFSQFVIMLNVLEDYCNTVGFPVERIDGTVKSRDRQQAIDRFSAEGEGSDGAFVFLLSTRAGGQGITLTAADTCIIYDSDWNPQNDLQAMARCHRIGQKKEVTVYRLISRDTYEMALFNTASRKYGLDEAILGFSGGSDPESDSARIVELLRHGAHGLLADMEAGLKQGEEFASEDITQILAARTEKRQIGSRAGNTFSVATFAADDGPPGPGLGGPRGGRRKRGGRGSSGEGDGGDEDGEEPAGEDYWRTLMPDAVAAHEAKAAEGPMILGPRKRKQVNYNMNHKQYNPKLESDNSDDSDFVNSGEGEGEDAGDEGAGGEGAAAGGEAARKGRGGRPRKQSRGGSAEAAEGQEVQLDDADGKSGGRGRKATKSTVRWTKVALKALEERLVALGPDRWSELYEQLQPCKQSAAEVEAAGRAMWELYGVASRLETEKRKAFFAGMESLLDDWEGDIGQRPAPVAAAAPGTSGPGTSGAGAAGPVGGAAAAPAAPPPTAAATAPANTPDDYEEQLAKAILETVPESLHIALAGPTTVKRLLRDASEHLRHGASMKELSQLVRAAPAAAAVAAADGAPSVAAPAAAAGPTVSTGAVGIRAPYMSPPTCTLFSLGWWSRADDEALLMAAAQIGYFPGRATRTVEYALRNQPLLGRVVQKPPQPEQQQQSKEAGGAAEGTGTAATEAAAAPPPAKPVDASGDLVMAEAGAQQQQAPAAPPPAPRVPGPNAPLQLSAEEWKMLVSTLGRRLVKLIHITLDFHRKQKAGQSGMQPLVVVKPSRPSGPPPPSREATTAAAGGSGASRPQSGTAAAAALVAKAVVPSQQQPANIAAVVYLTVAALNASAAARRASGGNEPAPLLAAAVTRPLPAKPPQQHTSPPAAQGGAVRLTVAGAAPGQQQQPQQRPADPQRRTSGEVKQQNRPAAAAAAAAAPPAVAAAASKPNGLKQSTLPFSRLGGSGSKKSTSESKKRSTPATEVGEVDVGAKKVRHLVLSPGSPFKRETLTLAGGAPAARAAPGSADKPIEIEESS